MDTRLLDNFHKWIYIFTDTPFTATSSSPSRHDWLLQHSIPISLDNCFPFLRQLFLPSDNIVLKLGGIIFPTGSLFILEFERSSFPSSSILGWLTRIHITVMIDTSSSNNMESSLPLEERTVIKMTWGWTSTSFSVAYSSISLVH